MGWRINGTIDSSIKKCVFMVMPHTSNFDFFLGVFTRGILDMEMSFVGKKELFKFPFNYYFKYMGGEPIDRTGGKNSVEGVVEIFKRKEIFRLAIAPEGTRKNVKKIKTGFYYIALNANVPIIPVAFDYANKQVAIGEPFYPSNDYEKDIKVLNAYFTIVNKDVI